MRLRHLTPAEIEDLIAELRTMAELPTQPNPDALRRAKEIRFLISGRSGTSPTATSKIDAAYRDLEILLHATRWQSETSVDVGESRGGFKRP